VGGTLLSYRSGLLTLKLELLGHRWRPDGQARERELHSLLLPCLALPYRTLSCPHSQSQPTTGNSSDSTPPPRNRLRCDLTCTVTVTVTVTVTRLEARGMHGCQARQAGDRRDKDDERDKTRTAQGQARSCSSASLATPWRAVVLLCLRQKRPLAA
jgi:hypothetical protein